MSERATGLSGDLEVRVLREDEEQDYFSFLRRCLPAADRVIEIHEWRRRLASQSGGVTTMVALLDGRIVGAQSTGPVELTYRGQSLRSAYHLDTIVDPDVRGRGLGKKLTLATAAPWAVTMAKGTQPKMYALRKGIGFSDVPRSTFLARSVSLARPTSLRSVAMHVATAGMSTLLAPMRFLQRVRDLSVARIESFGPEFDALELRSRGAALLRPAKPAAYLNWRYTTCPGRVYDLHRVDGPDGLRGASIVRWPSSSSTNASTGGQGDAWLVDVVTKPGDGGALDALLARLLLSAKERGVRTVRAFATDPVDRRSLGRHGFLDTRYSPRFTYILGHGAPDLEYERLAWDFWHGDADTEFYY